jgi:hypothetical protein
VAAKDPERWHRRRLFAASALAVTLITALAAYGQHYYLLGAADRPYDPLHPLLRPSGPIGIKLGMLGTAMFLAIFLYPVRKRVPWLAKRGSSRHWLDFHVVLGLSAPLIIAFHSSFKFGGLAGMAFWIMSAVALSGIVGRYLYAQIPRSLSSAEVSLKELRGEQAKLMDELAKQKFLNPGALAPIFAIPTDDEIRSMPVYRMILVMMELDLLRPFQVARLRRQAEGFGVLTLGGLLATSNRELERIVTSAKQCSSLAKRIAFLGRTQKVFHLWHVVHRPFSYSFAVLAVVHIGVVMSLGFF